RHMHAVLSARINKTDRNDALGIAQMMRVGLFKPVHVKTAASQRRHLLDGPARGTASTLAMSILRGKELRRPANDEAGRYQKWVKLDTIKPDSVGVHG